MSRAAYNLEFFPRRRSGFEDAGFAVEQFSQVITGDCFVYSKHTSHLFLMLDFNPQSSDHTSVTFTEPLLCADIKSLSRSQNDFFLRSNRSNGCSLFALFAFPFLALSVIAARKVWRCAGSGDFFKRPLFYWQFIDDI